MRLTQARGFSLVELMVVVAMTSVLGAIAIPSLQGATQLYSVNSSTQSVTSAVRAARYVAISRNATMRVRFNSPAAGQFTVVDLGGAVVGPVMMLAPGVTFGTYRDLQVDASGRIVPLTGCPNCVTGAAPASIAVGNGGRTRTVTVTANGQISTN